MSQAEALEQARQLFADSGLPFPFIPPEMTGEIRQITEWVYGTRSDQAFLYYLTWFINEVGTTPVADYLLFGHDGHGINSYAIHYYLVRGPLALFVQESWGSAYGDKEKDSQAVAERFSQAEALVHAVETAQQRGVFKPDERLVVVTSSFYGAIWRRLQGLEANSLAFTTSTAWREEKNILPAVLQVLEHSVE